MKIVMIVRKVFSERHNQSQVGLNQVVADLLSSFQICRYSLK